MMINVQRQTFVEFVSESTGDCVLMQFGSEWTIRCDLAGENVGLASQRSGANARTFKTLDAAHRELSGILADAGVRCADVRVCV
jgi:hypothetical protein